LRRCAVLFVLHPSSRGILLHGVSPFACCSFSFNVLLKRVFPVVTLLFSFDVLMTMVFRYVLHVSFCESFLTLAYHAIYLIIFLSLLHVWGVFENWHEEHRCLSCFIGKQPDQTCRILKKTSAGQLFCPGNPVSIKEDRILMFRQTTQHRS
jgi:hypothetical protein